ncbi:MAG: phosphatase PAP2 family protein [Candidatus Nanoarchaeia archaeon]|nr:phosphatase PAP2 family protein [Candidatus Nanoarchaeia archaeon]
MIILAVILISKKKLEWILPFFISTTAAYLITYILKFAFARPRPNSIEMSFLLGFNDYSFPSAHAAVAFAMLPILTKEHPKGKWVWIILAFLIAFSRIYIGVHYLSDVVAGALIGYITGMFIINLKQRKWKLTNSK